MSKQNKNKQGSVHVLIMLAFVLTVAALSAIFLYRYSTQGGSSKNDDAYKNYGDYNVSIEKHTQKSPFIHSYALTFEWQKYKNASEGDAIAIPELTLTGQSENAVTVSVRSKIDKYSNPCALTEPWNCGAPKLPEATLDLPDNFVRLNEKRTVILRVGDKAIRYTLNSQNYYLSLTDSRGRKLSSIPQYPNGVAAAVPTYAGTLLSQTASGMDRKAAENAQHTCEQLTPEMIIHRLRQYKIRIASDTYPGIESIRPRDVLVITTANHVYNGLGDEEAALTPNDESGCRLVLSGTYY